jgi:hypothetical protein
VINRDSVVLGHFFLFRKTTFRTGDGGVSFNHPGILPVT